MNPRARLISRIALFSALIYVLSWATAYFPNVNLAFFLAFSAGYLWGALPGLLVGGIGMGLWSGLNPVGPASPPVFIAQVLGMAACGLVGRFFSDLPKSGPRRVLLLLVAAVLCTAVFYLPVSVTDAWVYGPFWPRFYTGLVWMGFSLVANLVIFPLLFNVTRKIYSRESGF